LEQLFILSTSILTTYTNIEEDRTPGCGVRSLLFLTILSKRGKMDKKAIILFEIVDKKI